MTVSSVVRQRAVTCLQPLSGSAKRDLTFSALTQQPDKLAGSELPSDYTLFLEGNEQDGRFPKLFGICILRLFA